MNPMRDLLTCAFTLAVLCGVLYGMKAEVSSECRWQRCGLRDGKPVNCEPEESGAAERLLAVLVATEKGSVVYSCETERRKEAQ